MKTYLFTFCGAFLLALGFTPLVMLLAYRFQWVDMPGLRKIHRQPVARLGGIAVFLATLVVVFSILFLPNAIGASFREIQSKVLILLGCGVVIFLLGLWDDIRGLSAGHKLLGQILATVVLCSAGIRIKTFGVEGLFLLNFGVEMQWLLTLIWVIGVTNAVNLIDGLDGLAAGIAAIACGVMAALAVFTELRVLAVLMLALMGALIGFLVYNFNPAKIFIGDCGSLFLGFMLAGSSMMCAAKSHALVGLALPLLALGVPIFDTLLAMLRRFLQRRGIMSPDRDHFHHRLLALGFKQHHVAIIAYGITGLISTMGLFLLATRSIGSVLVALSCLVLLTLVFHLAGSLQLHEAMEGIRKQTAIRREQRAERRSFDHAQLHFREIKTFDEWWQAICQSAVLLELSSLSLPLTRRDGSHYALHWTSPMQDKMKSHPIRMAIPIRDRRTDSSLQVDIEITPNGSLESAGRRAALFTRLVEENGVELLNQTEIELS
ncbi:MAG: undecaprenyl/decaprenyl-phosphate alpha-N-acetylglucosaminyl 1-phosphate transferase [Sedimentisphaerales bacterium]|nr:undecaprenyl/decaprenyl-phosphate alpha-N-acetylglucosaminyl 1-phosphate transferase [Sedimentisphaerales bacterium]